MKVPQLGDRCVESSRSGLALQPQVYRDHARSSLEFSSVYHIEPWVGVSLTSCLILEIEYIHFWEGATSQNYVVFSLECWKLKVIIPRKYVSPSCNFI